MDRIQANLPAPREGFSFLFTPHCTMHSIPSPLAPRMEFTRKGLPAPSNTLCPWQTSGLSRRSPDSKGMPVPSPWGLCNGLVEVPFSFPKS